MGRKTIGSKILYPVQVEQAEYIFLHSTKVKGCCSITFPIMKISLWNHNFHWSPSMNGAILSVISLPVNVPPLLSLLHMDFLNAIVCSVVLNYPSRQKTPEKISLKMFISASTWSKQTNVT